LGVEGSKNRTDLPRTTLQRIKGLESWLMECVVVISFGALNMLLSELDSYKMDITAIQEIRWTGEGIIDKKNHTIFYNCDRKDHMFGTAFIVNKGIKHLVTTLKPKHPEYVKYVLEDFF